MSSPDATNSAQVNQPPDGRAPPQMNALPQPTPGTRRHRHPLVAACLLAMTTAQLFATQPDAGPTPPAGTPVAQHGRLRVAGRHIVGQHGQPAVLRGMSLFWSQSRGEFYNPAAVRWLRDDWNCQLVRAAIGVENHGYLNHPEREAAKARAVIDAAIDLGIYVIVDWHDHQAHLHPDQAVAFFQDIARRYGKHPNIIYEVWNEPLPDHPWSTVIKPYHEKLVAAIRGLDPDNLIVLGTRTWSQDVDEAAMDPVRGRNLAYALHFYAGTHRAELRAKAATALERGLPLMVTEWGTGTADGDGQLDEAESRRWWQFMADHQLSWCNWSITDKAETTAALRPGAPPNGGWTEGHLTPSGTLVRHELRRPSASPPNTAPKPQHHPAPSSSSP